MKWIIKIVIWVGFMIATAMIINRGIALLGFG